MQYLVQVHNLETVRHQLLQRLWVIQLQLKMDKAQLVEEQHWELPQDKVLVLTMLLLDQVHLLLQEEETAVILTYQLMLILPLLEVMLVVMLQLLLFLDQDLKINLQQHLEMKVQLMAKYLLPKLLTMQAQVHQLRLLPLMEEMLHKVE